MIRLTALYRRFSVSGGGLFDSSLKKSVESLSWSLRGSLSRMSNPGAEIQSRRWKGWALAGVYPAMGGGGVTTGEISDEIAILGLFRPNKKYSFLLKMGISRQRNIT
jgi:hypothetical protein